MKKVSKDSYIKNFLQQRYRDFVLKPALKILNKHQQHASIRFWTMPYDSICKAMILNKFYESQLLEGMCEIVKNKDGIALDIGANLGNHSLYFSKQFDLPSTRVNRVLLPQTYSESFVGNERKKIRHDQT